MMPKGFSQHVPVQVGDQVADKIVCRAHIIFEAIQIDTLEDEQ